MKKRPHCVSPRGFILLQTLWLLALASLLVAGVMATSLNHARNGAAATAAFQVETAAESAVHKAIYDMLTLGAHRVSGGHVSTSNIVIDGVEVSVSILNSR